MEITITFIGLFVFLLVKFNCINPKLIKDLTQLWSFKLIWSPLAISGRYHLICRKIFTFIILSSIPFAPNFSQNNYYQHGYFNNITVNEGLTHRTTNSIIQDSHGDVWFGTNNGLNRYDGHNIRFYQSDINDLFSLPNNRIRKLYLDRNEKLWILCETGELCWYDPDRDHFKRLNTLWNNEGSSLLVRDMAMDSSKLMWLITDTQLFNFKLDGATTEKISLSQIQHQFLQHMLFEGIEFDSQNNLWLATINDRVQCFSISKNKVKNINHFKGNEQLQMVSVDHLDNLWFYDQAYIYKAQDSKSEPGLKRTFSLNTLGPTFNGSITAIKQTPDKKIWISTLGSGLYQLIPKKNGFDFVHFSGKLGSPSGLYNNHLSDIFIDRFNVLWIASQSGIFWHHLNQKAFFKIQKTANEQNTLIHNIVHTIYRDKFLWIGTRNGLSVIDTQTNHFHNYPFLTKNHNSADEGGVNSIIKDAQGTIWIGTGSAGLFRVLNPHDPSRLTFMSISNGRHSNFKSKNIVRLAEDDWGRLWVGTLDEGIFFLSDNPGMESSYLEFEHIPGLLPLNITNLYKDPFKNILWFGTWKQGLGRLMLHSRDSVRIDFFIYDQHIKSISYNHVTPIAKSDPNTVWVGTIGGGLNKMVFGADNQITYTHYTTSDGLPDNTIHSMQVDNDGNLWLGGTGLSRFDPTKQKVTNYNYLDGLQSDLFIVNASYKDRNGRLYFGGPHGLSFFDPGQIDKEESLPNIQFTGLKIRNKRVTVGEEINGRVLLDKGLFELDNLIIKEKENDLTVEFKSIHTAIPAKNRLKYRLLGYSEDWIIAENSYDAINYSNLRPGTYSLQVLASNGDGVWTQNPTELTITVLPYWFKTNWAFLLYFLFFLLLLLLFRKLVIYQTTLRNNLKIAQIEIEKDHELAKMKNRFFNNITHELRTPLTLIKGPIDELQSNELLSKNLKNNYYQIIQQNTKKLIHLVNSLLDFRKAETGHFKLAAAPGNFVPFAKEIFLSFQHLAHSDIAYSFECSKEEIPLYFDRNKMEIVLCNLLSNAFKFMHKKGRITMQIEMLENHCRITIADTGKGIPPDKIDKIFNRFYQISKVETTNIIGTGIGLSMVKSIIDLHHGQVKVTSHEGKGSQFNLFLPLGSDHLTAEEMISDFKSEDHALHYQQTPIPKNKIQVLENQLNLSPLLKMLIVEDNADIRSFIKSIFVNQFDILEASNGMDGINILRADIPDIILSDIMMDKMDGITFCNQIKNDKRYCHIPFILLTARSSNVFKVDGLNSGADAYITKPFNPQVLYAQVKSMLRSQAALKSYVTNRITLNKQETEHQTPEVEFIEVLIAVIEQNLDNDLSAEKLAIELGLSHSTLYRKVKSYTGHSINSFIRSIRLKKAAQILLSDGYTISEVAYQVGFADVNYFGKCFRRQFRMSPTTFIKSQKTKLKD